MAATLYHTAQARGEEPFGYDGLMAQVDRQPRCHHLVALAAVSLLGCGGAPPPAPAATPIVAAQWTAHSAAIMATSIDVQLPADHAEHAELVFAAFRDVEARMNEWQADSPLAVLNRAGAAPVVMPADLRHLIRRGIELGEATGGAFDITWAALWGLWSFFDAEPKLPDAADVVRQAAHVDYRRVELDDEAGTVRLADPEMRMGLGGIAKGYALDQAAAALREAGVDAFSLSAGGQVYAAGRKGDRPWRVGIRDPRGEPDDWFAVVEVTDQSVSTSGDYERFVMIDGVRFHHILDPRTGTPAQGLRSATVIADEGLLADALSTAVMVLGRDEGLALAARLPGVEALVVDDQGAVAMTEGMRERLELRHMPIGSEETPRAHPAPPD